MAKPDKEQTLVLAAFKRMYENTVVNASVEMRVSELPPEDQADYWRRNKELHPSSFPVCPLRMAYERLGQEDDPMVYSNFGSDFFLNVGTLSHLLLQKWTAKSGKIVGNWSCLKCKAKYRFCTLPAKCRKCKHDDFKYHELGGREDNVSWHTDSLFLFREDYYLVDWKTTSDYMMGKHRKDGKTFPYRDNKIQAESYVPLIEHKYNIVVKGIILGYMSRSSPNKIFGLEPVFIPLSQDRKDYIEERLQRFKDAHKLALGVHEAPVKVFKRAIATKLCEDQDFYEEQVRGFDPCPLAENGACWKKKLLSRELNHIIRQTT